MRRMLILLPAVMLTVLAALTVGCGTGERRTMERLLAEADSMNRNYIDFTTDSVMLTVVDYGAVAKPGWWLLCEQLS